MLSRLGLSRLSMSEAVDHGRSPGASSDQPLRSRRMSGLDARSYRPRVDR